jgi:predicted esterase YcpF (UPF0227 family)
MMIYVYLHGFNSGYDPDTPKAQALSTIGDVIGVTYDSFATYQEIFEQISHEVFTQVHDRHDIVFIGTSLGGFWAAEMGRRFGVPSVIINPCHDPYAMLRKYVGEILTNYVTGVTNVLTNEVVETYPTFGITGENRAFGFLPLVLIDMGDEVIDSAETFKTLKGFPTMVWQDGSHRFDHMDQAIPFIQQYANRCSVVDHMD